MAEKKFEEAMQRLEEIVESLEESDLSLKDSLKIFEEGVKLIGFCSKRLEEVDQKVTMLGSTLQAKNRNLTNHVRVESGTIIDLDDETLVIGVADSCLRLARVLHAGRAYPAGAWAKRVRALIGEKFQ